MENKNFSIPMAIIAAGIIIAGAIIFTSKDKNIAQNPDRLAKEQQAQIKVALDNLKGISGGEYVRGDINAPVKLFEYSDVECPFCKRFHVTMNSVLNEYVNTGKVAWIYRHFPLDQIHPNARKGAIALECAGEIGGKEKFWSYLDKIYALPPTNTGLDLITELPKIAISLGIDSSKFNSCLSSGRHDSKVETDFQNALATGGEGTPWSIIVSKSGKKYPVNGAQPYEMLKQTIEMALQDK